MTKLALLLLFAGLNVLGQSIRKNDGTTIDVAGGEIHVEAGNKRLTYFQKDSKVAQRIKFKDLNQATWSDFKFKTFAIDGKPKGYYIIAEDGGKTLACAKRIRIKSRGGFESTYTQYEVVVLDAQNKILDAGSFTDENTDKKATERGKVIPMIKSHFAACPKLVETVTAFESPPSDTKNTTILALLNEPTIVKCE